jgi:hypothetical protein
MMSQDFRAEEGAWQGEQFPCPNYQTYQIEVEGVVRVDIRYQRVYISGNITFSQEWRATGSLILSGQ